jgi:hypothetical protein
VGTTWSRVPVKIQLTFPMVSTLLTRRGMQEEGACEEAGNSYDPQAEIVHLNEKIAQLERELQDRDRMEQQNTREDLPHDGHVNSRNAEKSVEEAIEGESSADGDYELANLIKENEKEKKEWADKLAKMEQQYDYLMGSTQSRARGKASLADSLFSTTTSPFTDRIVSCRLPNKFKIPEIPVYTGLGDPIEHLASFRAHIVLVFWPHSVFGQNHLCVKML